ncbi:MAG: c-type cytochrome biogenesis protein CcmI [Gammaproteobacteria bacterium]
MFVPIVLISLIVLVYPLLKRDAPVLLDEDETRMRANVVLYRQRLAEFDEDLASGKLQPDMHEQLVSELKLNLVEAARVTRDRRGVQRSHVWLIASLVVIIPAASGWLYTQFSPRKAVDQWLSLQSNLQPTVQKIIDDPSAMRTLGEDIDLRDFFRVMQRYLQSQKQNPDGWSLFADMMSRLDVPGQATVAARKAYEQEPDNRRYALRFAQLELASNEGKMTPRAERVLREWSIKSPNDPGVFMLLGMGYYASEQWARAVDAWQSLLNVMGERPSEDKEYQAAVQSVRRNLNSARARLDRTLASSSSPTAPTGTVSTSRAAKLARADTDMLRSAPASARLFVYAKAIAGMPMPVAVKKLTPTSFPVDVVLTVGDAMMPTATLAQHQAVKVFARWSLSGQIAPDAQDVVAESALVNPASDPSVVLELAAEAGIKP